MRNAAALQCWETPSRALFHAREASLVAAKDARIALGNGKSFLECRSRQVVVVVVLRDVHGNDGLGRAKTRGARFGYEHGVDSGGVEARLVASLEEIALAYSAIDEHPRACCSVFDDGGVAFAPACEHM